MMFFFDEILEIKEIKDIVLNDKELLNEGKIIAEKIIGGESIKPESGMLPFAVFAYLADFALKKHEEMGVPHNITVDTLKDVNVWAENYKIQYGKTGFAEWDWVLGFYLGERFRLKRLQFNFASANEYIPGGEICIEVHIPQGEPLNIDVCLESFNMAKEFFKNYYPEKKPEYFICDSWLLSPDLVNIADEESNIVRFMKLWTQFPFKGDNSAQAMERVFGFGFKREDLINAPEKTRLQRSLKNYLLNGGNVNMSAGYIKI